MYRPPLCNLWLTPLDGALHNTGLCRRPRRFFSLLQRVRVCVVLAWHEVHHRGKTVNCGEGEGQASSSPSGLHLSSAAVPL